MILLNKIQVDPVSVWFITTPFPRKGIRPSGRKPFLEQDLRKETRTTQVICGGFNCEEKKDVDWVMPFIPLSCLLALQGKIDVFKNSESLGRLLLDSF